MADNSSRLDASGVSETLASDDIGGVKYQRVKLNIGADGSAFDVLVPADAMTAANAGILPVASELFNETTLDRQRGNTQGTLLASAARTTTTGSGAQTNYNARGVMVFLNITVASGTGGLQTTVLQIDPVSAASALYAAPPTAIVATGLYIYALYPGASAGVAGPNRVQQSLSGVLSRSWQVQVIHGDASSYTYSVGYSLIV